MSVPISRSRIEDAATAIDRTFSHTPQYVSEGLSEALGAQIVCKVESVGPIGSFKGRGVQWWFRSGESGGKVVCASAGNFGQAVAFFGRAAGIEVHVFASTRANPAKLRAMRRLGATVWLEGEDFDAAKDSASDFARSEACPLIEDGSDLAIAEGAGTIGLELTAEFPKLDVLYVPVGNGSLASGVGWWFEHVQPQTRVIGVCAAGAPAMRDSWLAKRAVTTPTVQTIADGVAIRVPVASALRTLEGAVDDVILVDDTQILEAMRSWLEYEQLVAEPSGAISLAAATLHEQQNAGKQVGVVLTGGNIDPSAMRELVRSC